MGAAETTNLANLVVLCGTACLFQMAGVATTLYAHKRQLGGKYVIGWLVPLVLIVGVAVIVYFALDIAYPCSGSGCGMGLVLLAVVTFPIVLTNAVLGILVQFVLWLVLRRRNQSVKGA